MCFNLRWGFGEIEFFAKSLGSMIMDIYQNAQKMLFYLKILDEVDDIDLITIHLMLFILISPVLLLLPSMVALDLHFLRY